MSLNRINSQLIEPSVLSGSKGWILKNTDYTSQPYENLSIDTSSNIVNITLPNNPPDDSRISIRDYNDTFDINKLVIKRQSGVKIMNINEDMEVSTKGICFTLIYKANSNDWRIQIIYSL